DGIAGAQVYQVLLAPRPVPARRRVLRLSRSVSVAAAAQELGVSAGYLRRVNRLREERLQAGRELAVYPRWGLLYVDPALAGMLAPRQEGRSWPRVTAGGLPWPFAWNRWPADQGWRRPRRRPDAELAQVIEEAASHQAVAGFHLSRQVSWGQGQAWASRL